jgi:hypothetical protein
LRALNLTTTILQSKTYDEAMPIEIKELIIRAIVSDESEKTSDKPVTPSASADGESSKDERVISRCVEQVMEILTAKGER